LSLSAEMGAVRRLLVTNVALVVRVLSALEMASFARGADTINRGAAALVAGTETLEVVRIAARPRAEAMFLDMMFGQSNLFCL